MDDDGAQRMRMAAHHAALTAAFFQQASVAPPHSVGPPPSWPVDQWPMLASMAAAAQLAGGSAVPMQPAAAYAAAFPQLPPRNMPYSSGSWSAIPAAGNPRVLGPEMWQAIFGGWTSPGLHPNAVLSMGAQPPVCSAAVVQPPSYFNVVSGQLGVMEGQDLRTCLRPLGRQEAVAVASSNATLAATALAVGAESTSAANTVGRPRDQASPVGSCRHTFRTGSLHAFSPYSRSRTSSQNASSAPSDTCLDLSVPRGSDSFTDHRPSPVAATANDMAPAPSVLSEAAPSLAAMTSGSAGCGIRTASAKSEREGGRKAPIPVGIAVAWQRRQEPVDPLTRETTPTVSKGDLEGQPLVPTACDGQGLPEPVGDCTTMPIRSQLCLENSLSPGKTAHHRKSLTACAVRYEDRPDKVKDAADALTQKAITERALQSESGDTVAFQAAISPEDMAQAAVERRLKMLAEGGEEPDDTYQYSISDDDHSAKECESENDENDDGTIDMRSVSEEATTVATTTPGVPMMSVMQAVVTSSTGEFGRKRKERHSAKSRKKKKKQKKEKHSCKEKSRGGEKKRHRKLGKLRPPGKEKTVETSAVSLQLGGSGCPPRDRKRSKVSPIEQLPVDDQVAGTMLADSGRLAESNENDSVHVRYGQVSYDLTDDRSLLALCKSFSERKLALEEAKNHYKGQQLRLGLELAQMETGQQAAANGSEMGSAAASSGVSARSSANSRSDLHLSVEDLTEGARLLLFIRGLPHEGTVVCLEPPSVYGVVLASQRSARPRVYAREDLLRDAVRDVQPTRAEDLRHGSRVCAYWSSQFDCLYPGVVVKVLHPENAVRAVGSGLGQATRSKLSKAKTRSGRVLVEITFDDRDSGTFALEQIRMLPTGFPHTPTQFEFANGDDDVLSVVPAERRLRSSSGSSASAAAAAAVAPSSGLSPVSVAGPQSRCHPRSCRNRQAAESATAASQGFSESDDEPLNMLSKHAGVPSTSSSGSGSEWVWSGSPTRAHVTAGSHGRRRSDKVFYSAIRRGNELLKVGDCAVFARREENMPPFVGTILSLWQGRRRMTVRVQWFYHPEEIADDSVRCGNQSLIGALFESEHEDEVNVQSILHRCEVLPMAIYRERRLHRRSAPADAAQTHAVFCIVGSYDAVGGRVTEVLEPSAAVATEEVTALDTASKQVHD